MIFFLSRNILNLKKTQSREVKNVRKYAVFAYNHNLSDYIGQNTSEAWRNFSIICKYLFRKKNY